MRPIVIDHGSKEKLCKEMGAEVFIDFTQTKDTAAAVVEAAGGVGAHGVVVTAYQAYKGKCLQFRWNFTSELTISRFV